MDAAESSQQDSIGVVDRYFDDLHQAMASVDRRRLAALLDALRTAVERGRRIFVVGNGGSAATASHMATDIGTALATRGSGASVYSLSDNVARLTALANDISYEQVFAAQLAWLAGPDDVLLSLSVSGESANVVEAVRMARKLGLVSLSLLGHPGCIAEHSDHWLCVSGGDYGTTEDIHLAVNHMMVRMLRGVPHVALSTRVPPGRVEDEAGIGNAG